MVTPAEGDSVAKSLHCTIRVSVASLRCAQWKESGSSAPRNQWLSGKTMWHVACRPFLRARQRHEDDMDYLKPSEVITSMIEAGSRKGALSVTDLLVRGALSR